MKEERSSSQILFGFLPGQTVDLRGRIWRVKEWINPIQKTIDAATLQRELQRQAAAWAANGRDGRFVEHMRQGRKVTILSVNHENGVRVVPFPEVWMCRDCKRIRRSDASPCACGKRKWGQLPFVGYHSECGAIRAPWIRPCREHNDVKVVLPGTASAAEIKFICPVCSKTLATGFGFPKCECGGGTMTFNVHRAASVFTPRSVVVVNPPSVDSMQRLYEHGGPRQALSWVLNGLEKGGVAEQRQSKDGFLQQMLAQGFDSQLARQLADQAETAGQFGETTTDFEFSPDVREEAEAGATSIALGLDKSRVRIADLADRTDAWSELGILYRDQYPAALSRAGLEDIELIERFPVLTANYGYTRGDQEPGASRLVPFQLNGNYVVYGDIAETEALFVRLRPSLVAQWLLRKGHQINEWSTEKEARAAILEACRIPQPGSNVGQSAGDSLLTLIHSFCHRFIRRIALYAGIERNALSELLVAQHCSFFVYAAARGDFVLGGLQSVLESDLANFLRDLVFEDHRCPLDPGCQRGGGACMACLHLGEPSCRYFNSFLDRSSISGPNGYMRLAANASSLVPS